MLQVVLAQRRVEAAELPATAARPERAGLLSRVRRAAALRLTAGQQAVAAEIASDLARSHPMHRLLQGEVGVGQDGRRAARDARRRRRRRAGGAARARPRCWPSSTTARSPPCSGPLGRARSARRRRRRHPGRAAHRIAGHGGPPPAPCSTRRRASAGIVVGTHALSRTRSTSSTSASSSSTSSTASASSSATRCAPRRAAAARAGHDRHPDPAHGGDDRLRRPRRLHAARAARRPRARSRPTSSPVGEQPHFLDRAWQRVREEVEAGHQAYVVCPRIGESITEDEDAEEHGGLRLVPDLEERAGAASGGRGARHGRRPCRGAAGRPAASRCCTGGCRPTPRTR